MGPVISQGETLIHGLVLDLINQVLEFHLLGPTGSVFLDYRGLLLQQFCIPSLLRWERNRTDLGMGLRILRNF